MRINDGIISDLGAYATLKVDLVTKGWLRRPGITIKPKYITIHNTGGANVKADNYRCSQLDVTQDKETSWHFTVDEKEVIQHIPLNEVAWHAGNQTGNYNSFAVEVCEREGAEEVAIKFIAELLTALEWDTTHIKTHKYWSGKQCPHLILPHLTQFIDEVKKGVKCDDQLVEAVIKLYNNNILTTPRVWSKESDMKLEYVPGLLSKMGGISRLVGDGIISTPSIWQSKLYTTSNVRSLIIKYAYILK